jgi:phage portal protein BeeE
VRERAVRILTPALANDGRLRPGISSRPVQELPPYRGVYNASEPIILDRLIEDMKRITNTAAEMDFLNSSGLTKERICQLFGVSPAAMGDVDTPNRASSAAADDHLCKNTLSPKCAMISAALTKWVAPRFDGDVVTYIEEPRASDPDGDRADREQLARYGATTVNELRAAAHLEPIDGGDVLIEAGIGYGRRVRSDLD